MVSSRIPIRPISFRPTKQEWFRCVRKWLFLHCIAFPAVYLLFLQIAKPAFPTGFPLWMYSPFVFSPLMALLHAAYLSRVRVECDENTIVGFDSVSFRWKEIRLSEVFLLERRLSFGLQHLLCATDDIGALLVIHGLDIDSLWNFVTSRVPPVAYTENAFQNHHLMRAQAIFEENERNVIRGLTTPVQVHTHRQLWIKILGFGFMAFVAYIGVRDQFWIGAFGMGGLALYLLYDVSWGGSLTATTYTVTLKNWWGTYQIEWDEVTSVEYWDSNGYILLRGTDKYLALPGKEEWNGEAREAMIGLFVVMLADRNLHMITRNGYRRDKNTKIDVDISLQ